MAGDVEAAQVEIAIVPTCSPASAIIGAAHRPTAALALKARAGPNWRHERLCLSSQDRSADTEPPI
jgi:hypothetical protein